MKYVLSALWLFLLAVRSEAELQMQCATCDTPYSGVGCYRDDLERPLPNEILNERDPTSSVWDGYRINWGNWETFMPQMVCRCAKKAKELGYKYFAIQFWGECWAGNDIEAAKAVPVQDDSAVQCYNTTFQRCDTTTRDCGQFERCHTTDLNCVGKKNVNFIYQLEDLQCPEYEIERVGCFKDKHTDGSRPLPDYFYQERDDDTPENYGGRNIDWENYDLYLPRLACRCAQEAITHGYKFFGVQYYGECWGGHDLTYFQDGSGSCINRCFGNCLNTDRYCTGRNFELFVYRIRSSSCANPHSAVGCASGSSIPKELILTERDEASPLFNGFFSGYADWNSRFSEFVCACSMRSLERGYPYFGVTDDGDCFGTETDPSSALTDHSQCNKGGADSTACETGDSICGGVTSSETLFFYQIDIPTMDTKK